MKITKLLPTKLVAAEIDIIQSNDQKELLNTLISKVRGKYQYWYLSPDFPKEASYKYIGEVSEDKISFDAHSLFMKHDIAFRNGMYMYRNYPAYDDLIHSSQKSLYSLIRANGLELKNNNKFIILEEI